MTVMEQERKAGGLEKLYIACLKPSRYQELLSSGTGHHLVYLCCIVLLLTLIDTVIPFAAWDFNAGGIDSLVRNRFPAFTIEKGRMTIEQPVEFEIGGVIHFKADSGVEKYTKEDFTDKYQEELLFSGTNILIRMGEKIMDVPMDKVTDSKLDNKDLLEAVPLFRMMLLIYFLSTYLVKGVEYLISTAFFAVISRAAIRTREGKFVDLKGTFVIALYAKTLFSLLHSVDICAGFPVDETIIIILGTIGTILFIDKAEAAVLGI